VIVFEAATFILFLVFYQGARRAMGRSRNRAFLLGAVLFSLAVETTAVLGGVKNFYWYSLNSYYKHYPLGGYIIWLGLVPLAACLLWYMVAASSYVASSTLMPKRSIWARAAVAGAIATGFYLLIEPVAVTNHWWTWNLKSFYIIDVPLLAWIGVFLTVFLFTAVYQLTMVEGKEMPLIQKLEDLSIKRWPMRSRKHTKNLGFHQLVGVFLFRLAIAFVAFCAVMAPFMIVLWVIANRGQIPPGW